MTILPIVQRELIEASRRRSTYWLRVGVAAASLLVGAWVMAFPENRTPSRTGMALFIPLTVIAMLYCALIGIFRTADCLSEEKREGTLGLLFLTDLSGHDVVLGKLVATSVSAVYGLVAIFPVLAIPLLAGGVTGAEFGRVVLVSLNTLLFSLALGMFCSAVNRDERQAMTWALALTVFFVAGLPILAGIVESTTRWRNTDLAAMIALPSPSFSAVYAFDDARRGTVSPHYFLVSILTIHLLAWLLLISSALIVPRTWQDRPLSAAAQRRRRWIRGLGAGSVSVQTTRRQQLLEVNPMLWLVTRDRFKTLAVWAFLGLGAIAWTWGLLNYPKVWLEAGAYLMTSIAAHIFLKFWVAMEASRRFSLDRQSGALELILSTPLPARAMIKGQVQGIIRLAAGPVSVVLLADLAFVFALRHDEEWGVFGAGWILVFLADLVALTWQGMWSGVNSRRPNRAAGFALGVVLVLPWILIGLFFTGLAALQMHQVFSSNFWREYGFPIVYVGVSLGLDLLVAGVAFRNLQKRFRVMATQRFEMKARKA